MTINSLNVWHSEEWHEISQRRIDGIVPPYGEIIEIGDLWYDTVNDLLKVYTNNGTWVQVCLNCDAESVATVTPQPTDQGTTATPAPTTTPTATPT